MWAKIKPSSRTFISVQIIIWEVINMGHFQKYQKTDKMEEAVCGPSVRLLEQAGSGDQCIMLPVCGPSVRLLEQAVGTSVGSSSGAVFGRHPVQVKEVRVGKK